jgi:predicted O-methyltransferase YrrM
MPLLVRQAVARAHEAGFSYSRDPEVGRLLAALAAHLPVEARVLELGTGTGVGTAWITFGLLPRTDVTVIPVEIDLATAALAARGGSLWLPSLPRPPCWPAPSPQPSPSS